MKFDPVVNNIPLTLQICDCISRFVPGAPVGGEGDAKLGPSPQDYAAIKVRNLKIGIYIGTLCYQDINS